MDYLSVMAEEILFTTKVAKFTKNEYKGRD